MNHETRKALEDSIAHWERLVDGTRGQLEWCGAKDCALCRLYFRNACEGCPVRERSGNICCRETPYQAAADAAKTWGIDSLSFRLAASEMLAFLRGLLLENLTDVELEEQIANEARGG